MDDPTRRGPTVPALLVLAVATLALLATEPAPPSLQAYAIGEVLLDGSAPVARALRLHLDPSAGPPVSGSITLKSQSANGLGDAWPLGVSLGLEADGAPVPTNPGGGFIIPVDRCAEGCDLSFRVLVAPSEGVLPGSIARFEADARLDYQAPRWFGVGDTGLLTLALQDAAIGPPAVTWVVGTGLLAFVLGVLRAPRVDRRLGAARRHWPAIALAALLVGWLALRLVPNLQYLLDPRTLTEFLNAPQYIPLLFDPWASALLATLAWGLWRGVRRWHGDGGWSLGLAAVATAGLGGLWLVSDETSLPVVQPILFGVVLVVPAALAGLVLGQAWRVDAPWARDRVWAAAAILAHGILIAGFWFLLVQNIADPFGRPPLGLAFIVPITLVTLAFRRWLHGGRAWLVLFDLVIAAIGVLGLFLGRALTDISTDPGRIGLADVGIGIAVGASIVALVTAFHGMGAGPRIMPEGETPPEPGLDPATT